MDSNEAIDYLKKMHAEPDSQPAETASTEDPAAATGGQPGEPETPVPESDTTDVRETPKAEETEQAASRQQQRKPNRQERINHAFQREKSRHKAEIEAKDKRIQELEEKVKKYSVLEQGDFDPNDVKSYIDHKFALANEQGELASLKKERDDMVAADRQREASERHMQQVDECFTDQESKDHYWNLLHNGGQKFKEFLAEYDDGSIDSFIGDSKIAPLVISTLMRNTDVLKNIVEMRNPMRKMLALQQLENRLLIQRKVGTGRQAPAGTQQQKPNKAPLPILGSQVQTPGSSAESTKHDWNRWLTEHPF